MIRGIERAWWSAFTLVHARVADRLPWRPFAEIRALQNRHVRRIVRHAFASVPFYREQMTRLGLSPADIRGAEDLSALPIVEPDQVALEGERFRSLRFEPHHGLELSSSGTTSRPKVILCDSRALFIAYAHRQRRWAALRPTLGRVFGLRSVEIESRAGVASTIRAFLTTHSFLPPQLAWQRHIIHADGGFEANVLSLNDLKPDLLGGFGTYLGALFQWCHKHGIELHGPKAVYYGGDRMPESDRELIEQAFGVPVFSGYQATEVQAIAYQCELRRSFHVEMDDVVVRVVNAQGNSVAPGETGDILVSNLVNRATVLLNYRLGDVVTLGSEPCPCGRNFPTIDRIDGRRNDCLALPSGGSEPAWALLDRLETLPGVAQVQIIQEQVRRFRLRAIPRRHADLDEVRRRLTAALHVWGGAELEVIVELVERIPADRSGKVRAAISLCEVSEVTRMSAAPR